MKNSKAKVNRFLANFLDQSRFYAEFGMPDQSVCHELSPGQLWSFRSKFLKDGEIKFFLLVEFDLNKPSKQVSGFIVSINPLPQHIMPEDIIVSPDESPIKIPILVQSWNYRFVNFTALAKPIENLAKKIVEKAVLCRHKLSNSLLPSSVAFFRNHEITNSPGIPLAEDLVEIYFISDSNRHYSCHQRQSPFVDTLAAATQINDFQKKLYQLLKEYIIEKKVAFIIRNLGSLGLKLVSNNKNSFILVLRFVDGSVRRFKADNAVAVLSAERLSGLDFSMLKRVKISLKSHENDS